MKKKVCVIGLGYIGLPTAVVFADNGWLVTGVDVNPKVVNTINDGKVHIKEKGLENIIKKVVDEKCLVAEMTPKEADVFIIAVPTPLTQDTTTDLSYLINAVNSIMPVMKKGNIIIVESTIPPRTMTDIVSPIIRQAGYSVGEDIFLAHCPERVLPGKILFEMIENNRIIGGINSISAEKAAQVYKTFVKGELHLTNAESAEMAKLMENTYRDVNIALANELTKISVNLNIDPLEVIRLANKHPRVNIHQPGPGVGGHCLAIDPYFIIEKDPKNSILINKAREINESMTNFVVDKAKDLVTIGSTITLFGLAYKGNIDDIRESPALKIYDLLNQEGYIVKAYDPYIKQFQTKIKLYSYQNAIKNSDLVIILTDHNEFKEVDWYYLNQHMNKVQVLDTKNIVENSIEKKYLNYGNLFKVNYLKSTI